MLKSSSQMDLAKEALAEEMEEQMNSQTFLSRDTSILPLVP